MGRPFGSKDANPRVVQLRKIAFRSDHYQYGLTLSPNIAEGIELPAYYLPSLLPNGDILFTHMKESE